MERAYELVEVIGVSEKSMSDAIKRAVSAASKNRPGTAWFEVVEQRGRIDKGEVAEFQAKIRVGFRA